MDKIRIGFAMCGSFCTFEKAIDQIKYRVGKGYDVTPIMSENAYKMDTKFGKAEQFRLRIEKITGKKIINGIDKAEPIGPQKMFDVLVVAPCTGNTLGKISCGIVDTTVTMAIKSHLRNMRPVVLGVSTNDALSNCAQNIGKVLNYKNIYFIPMRQDNPAAKPRSIVADFSLIEKTIESAQRSVQIQPIFL